MINKKILSLLLFVFSANVIISQTLPFYESFSDNSELSKWSIVDDKPAYSGPSNWFIDNGILKQTSNIWAYEAPLEFKYHMGTHIVTGNSDWYDYAFNAIVKSSDDDGIGLVFRYQDNKNYYRFLLLQDKNNGGPVQSLQKIVNGEPVIIKDNKIDNPIPKNWFSMTIILDKDSILAYINGEHIFSAADDEFVKGKIGMMCYANSGAHFDSISVTSDRFIYSKPPAQLNFVERFPFISMPDSNTTLISWTTKEKSQGKLLFGQDSLQMIEILSDSVANNHQIELLNLEKNKKYYYSVFKDNTVFADHLYFHTPKPVSEKKFSFLIWGDSGTNTPPQFRVAALMEKVVDKVEFALHVGDVSQGNGEEYDIIFFQPYKNIVSKIPVFTAIGNHDTYYDGAWTYLNSFNLPSNNNEDTERYYSFTWGNSFFIILDSNIDYSPNSPQYRFLVEQLNSQSKKNAKWTFINFHHPPYCELWDTWGGEQGVRDYLVPLFEQYNVDFVVNGHTHGYERGQLNGVFYIITGGGGGGLDTYARDWPHIKKSFEKHHYSIVEVDGDNISFKAVDIDETVIDSFSVYKATTDVNEEAINNSIKFELRQNYPNPFNPITKIVFSLEETSEINLSIYNSLGELVQVLTKGEYNKGIHEIEFEASNLPSGIYMYRLNTPKNSTVKKMLLLK